MKPAWRSSRSEERSPWRACFTRTARLRNGDPFASRVIFARVSFLVHQQPAYQLFQLFPWWTALPFVIDERAAGAQVIREVFLQAACYPGIRHGHVDFVVQSEGARVEIGRSDYGPVAVLNQAFGVDHGGLIFEDSGAGAQQ